MRAAARFVTLAVLAACSSSDPPPADPSAGGALSRPETRFDVPFRPVKHQLLVDVSIAGQGPWTFLVDTGVIGSVVDAELAEALALELDRENPVGSAMSADGPVYFYPTSMRSVAVGANDVGDLNAVSIPLSAYGDKLGEPLHGILGHGFLEQYAVRVDFVRHVVSFSTGTFEAEFENADFTLPLDYAPSDIMPILDVTIGEHTFPVTIDTGSSLGLEVFAPYVEELGLADTVKHWAAGRILGATAGDAATLDGQLGTVAIGPLHFRDVPASITPARMDAVRRGNIGNRLWADHVLTLDYPRQRIAIRRAE